MRFTLLFILTAILFGCNSKKEKQTGLEKIEAYKGPIIDMHIHADIERDLPPISLGLCPPFSTLIENFDPQNKFEDVWNEKFAHPQCENPLMSPKSYNEYLTGVETQLKNHNIVAVASGSITNILEWKSKFPKQIIPSLEFRINRDSITPNQMKLLIEENGIMVIGEISNQYGGIAPNDPRMFPYYEVAEEMDIPVAIHLGSGIPGTPYMGYPDYEAKLSNPLLLEDVLKKFPKLRVSVMHYGEPFIDEMITMLYHYPQLYIDIGGIQWAYPKNYFYEYHLKKLILAGFGKRIMFGSDMIIWPELIAHSVDIINETPFLSYEQKADIFYNNASRFLRLEGNTN
ncbi:amidohydrolase family protein [Muricauda sp. 2012CJ35-5]|uniref:Amidohydrolase family protein n=1 Tax=Flagellimonas spongiicola TaxID=2942208 RepID=A0ABT0PUX2_9FLAO|nr:amidohydrolase family protein [Allomuricauda spongiicola]MCL6274507.1 amidohydrolase family protein [Allomuricauda spongiicola]